MPTLKEQVETLVANLVLNEARADVWVNGADDADYTPSGGGSVPSIQKFLAETFKYQGAYSAGGTDYTIGQTFRGASGSDQYKMFRVTANFTSTTFGGDSASYETLFDFAQVVTDAETAQAAAEAAQAAAEAAFDEFDDRYLGFKVSAPTLDNDGNALVDGATYWDTTDNAWYIYDLGNTTWVSPAAQAAAQVTLAVAAKDAAEVAQAAAEATLYDYGRIAWVDPVNGSDVTGAVGNFEKPYATMEEAVADLITAYPTRSEISPVTVKTLGGQTIPIDGSLIDGDTGFIFDLRDGTVLQAASGNAIILTSGDYFKIIGGELIADAGYAVVYTDAKFEAVDCVIEGNFSSSSRLVAIIGTGSSSQIILNRCVVANNLWAANSILITDCDITGSIWFNGSVSFEIYDSKIDGSSALLFTGVHGCIYFSDGGAARTIEGLIRNCYLRADQSDSYPIVYNLTNASNTFNVALQGCDAFTGHSKIIHEQGTEAMTFSGNVLYGNLATVGDGTLSGLTYDGDTNRGW